MKDEAIYLNSGRCSDKRALDALHRQVAGAGIDVFEVEPCTDSPLIEFDNVVLTPHIGGDLFQKPTTPAHRRRPRRCSPAAS
jgi:D-3-phosphoglycerate dehydrogenase